jgi:hypothetical protein
MIRVYLAFILLAVLFGVGIKAFRSLTGKEKLALTKIAGYSILCSVLSMTVLFGIVILF